MVRRDHGQVGPSPPPEVSALRRAVRPAPAGRQGASPDARERRTRAEVTFSYGFRPLDDDRPHLSEAPNRRRSDNVVTICLPNRQRVGPVGEIRTLQPAETRTIATMPTPATRPSQATTSERTRRPRLMVRGAALSRSLARRGLTPASARPIASIIRSAHDVSISIVSRSEARKSYGREDRPARHQTGRPLSNRRGTTRDGVDRVRRQRARFARGFRFGFAAFAASVPSHAATTSASGGSGISTDGPSVSASPSNSNPSRTRYAGP